MTNPRMHRHFMESVGEKARHLSRRDVYLTIVAFYLFVISSIGYGVVSSELESTWKVIESYRNARDRAHRARERGEQFKEVASRLSKAQHAIHAHGPLENVGGMAHSVVRESTEKTGLHLKGFVATDVEDEHLVTLDGAFRDVVMLIDALPHYLSSFQVRRLIVRLVLSHGDRIEVEMLIKKTPNTSELSPVCNTEVR